MSYSSYSTFIGLAVVITALFLVMYCVRLKYIHRHIAPHPTQVVVVAQHQPHQLQYPQMYWSTPMEQPPPPYTAAVAAMNTNHNNMYANNGS
jgi:hypothetical protein